MSSALAMKEMNRFLLNSEPEVLSVSGRWGVGKTFGWMAALRSARDGGKLPMNRYSYVSAFGVKSLHDLKTAVFQSGVRLDGPDIQPSLQSLQENITSLEGFTRLAEWGGRRAAKAAQKFVSALPWGGGAGDFILPAAALLIKNQIICIDDIERSGPGLDVSDILGFVSMLREERGCKVVLLLNEEGLGEDHGNFRRYLEKVVDQAVTFTPTPQESAVIALSQDDSVGVALRECTVKLGITNIRVIKRIRRFIGHVEEDLSRWHPKVLEHAIQTLTLFGWSIFEPTLAPNLEYLRARTSFGIFDDNADPTPQEAAWNALLIMYGFSHADHFDETLVEGLLVGGFDLAELSRQAELLSLSHENTDVRQGIFRPWEILGASFENNEDELVGALLSSVDEYSSSMSPADINSVVLTLRDLHRDQLADQAITTFMSQQAARPRQFFQLSTYHTLRGRVDPALREEFDRALNERPLERNPALILVNIEERSGWNPEDIEFLASLSEEQIFDLFKAARGDELWSMIRSALRFVEASGGPAAYSEFGRKARAALERISAESPINSLRLRPYLSPQDEEPVQ